MLCTSSNTTASKQSLQSPKTSSGCFKMTSEAAGTRPIIFSIKSFPCMPKAGSHSIHRQTRKWPRVASKWPRRLLGPCLSVSFSASKVTLVCPKQEANPYRAWPAILDKHTKQIPLCFISKDDNIDFSACKFPGLQLINCTIIIII